MIETSNAPETCQATDILEDMHPQTRALLRKISEDIAKYRNNLIFGENDDCGQKNP